MADTPSSQQQRDISLAPKRARQIRENIIRGIFLFCGLISILTTAAFIGVFSFKTFNFFQVVSIGEFFGTTEWAPLSFNNPKHGIWPLLGSTLLVTSVAVVVALPLGLLSAIFLSEFAPHRLRAVLKPILEVLAGIPTVVYGFLALLFVTPFLKSCCFPDIEFFNALSAGLVMGLMILPMVSSLSEDAMHAVPSSLREGAYGVGATRFEVALRVIVPAALSGITASFILAMSRAIGETMIVAIAMGQTPAWPPDLLGPGETLTAYIVNIATGDAEAGAQIWDSVFAVGMLLFILTLTLNMISHYIVTRFREKYE